MSLDPLPLDPCDWPRTRYALLDNGCTSYMPYWTMAAQALVLWTLCKTSILNVTGQGQNRSHCGCERLWLHKLLGKVVVCWFQRDRLLPVTVCVCHRETRVTVTLIVTATVGKKHYCQQLWSPSVFLLQQFFIQSFLVQDFSHSHYQELVIVDHINFNERHTLR